jgi:tetratricopeptide (TPR) repeat protein
LPDSTPLVADLLRAAPKLKVVTTSREPLRLQGEHIYRLEPLAVSAEGEKQYSDAQRLFADRAALVRQEYVLTPENAAQVLHFCEHLAGIPLAIELAAAWMDGFTLDELHDELTCQLELEARNSDLPERHRSLKACLDWSWKLLGEHQQTMLMKLSSFRGGFFAAAASAVLGLKGMGLRSALLKLRDKSWLYTREVDGQTRFFMRDMLAHEYAFAKLEETGRGSESLFEQAVRAHAAYYAGLAQRSGPRLNGGGRPDGGAAQLAALRSWRLELANILEALDSVVRRGKIAWLLPIARFLQMYLQQVSDYYTLRDCYSLLLDLAQAAGHDGLLTLARIGLGRAQWRLGNYSASRELTEQALALSRELGDRHGEADCLSSLGNVESYLGDFSAARSLFIQALALSRELGDRHGEAGCLNSLGSVEVYQSNHSSARELLEQSLRVA